MMRRNVPLIMRANSGMAMTALSHVWAKGYQETAWRHDKHTAKSTAGKNNGTGILAGHRIHVAIKSQSRVRATQPAIRGRPTSQRVFTGSTKDRGAKPKSLKSPPMTVKTEMKWTMISRHGTPRTRPTSGMPLSSSDRRRRLAGRS
jgi:hypothetical protein